MTLDDILNEPAEAPKSAAPATEPVEAKSANTEVVNKDTNEDGQSEKPKKAVNVDPDMVWDDDEDGHETSPSEEEVEKDANKAPDQISEEELNKIEDRNKWMKGRIAPVKQKLSKAEAEIERLKAENEQLKGGKTQSNVNSDVSKGQTSHTTIDDIVNNDPNVVELSNKLKKLEDDASNMTEKEYIDQKLDIISDLKMIKREIATNYQREITKQQEAIVNAENKIKSDLDNIIMAKKDIYPDIEKAYNRVIKNADKIDVEIRRAMIMENGNVNSNAGDIVNIIGNDPQAMSYLIAQSKIAKQSGRYPTAAIEYIGRLKAKISETLVDTPAPDVDETINNARRKPGIPKDVKSHSVGDPEDLSEWARKAIKSGQRPW
jgi:hypothetical protein